MKAYASFIAGRWLSGDEITKNVNPSDVGILYRVGQNRPQYRGRLREAGEEEPTRNGRQESNIVLDDANLDTAVSFSERRVFFGINAALLTAALS